MSGEKSASPSVATSKISGHVYSVDGAVLNSAKVACDGMETKTLADGFFVFDGLTAGTYDVKVSLQGFKSTSRSISTQEGEDVVLDFCLPKALGTAKIEGYVYDVESKEPIEEGGTVILILPVANRYKDIDRDGYYKFENLSADTYKILTSIPGYEDQEVTLTVIDDEIKTNDFLCKIQEIEEPPWG